MIHSKKSRRNFLRTILISSSVIITPFVQAHSANHHLSDNAHKLLICLSIFDYTKRIRVQDLMSVSGLADWEFHTSLQELVQNSYIFCDNVGCERLLVSYTPVSKIAMNNKFKQRRSKGRENKVRLYVETLLNLNSSLVTAQAPIKLRDLRQDDILVQIDTTLKEVFQSDTQFPLGLVRDLALDSWNYLFISSRNQEYLNIAEKGLKACHGIGDHYSLQQAYPALCNSLGLSNRMLGKHEEAESCYQRGLEMAIRNEEKSDLLCNMADISRLKGEWENAKLYAYKSIDLAQQIKDKNKEAKAFNYLGLTFHSLRDYDKAIECFTTALSLQQATNNVPNEALTLAFLSSSLVARGKTEDLKQARIYYERAWEIEASMDNKARLANIDGGLGNIHNKLGNYADAVDYLKRSYEYNLDIRFIRGCVEIRSRLVHAYIGLNDIERALDSADYVISNLDCLTIQDRKKSQDLNNDLIFLARNLENSRNREKAIEYLDTIIQLAQESEDNQSLETAQNKKEEYV